MAVNWVDGVLGGTPLTASNLNAMDLANPTSAAAIAASLAYESKGLSTATQATLNGKYEAGSSTLLYVSPTGNDSNSGRTASGAKATLAAAVSAMGTSLGKIVLGGGNIPLGSGVTFPSGFKASIVGQGQTKTVLYTTSQSGAALDFSAVGYAFDGSEIGAFTILGDGVANSANKGLVLSGTTSNSKLNVHDILVSSTGGACFDLGAAELCDFIRLYAMEPVNAGTADVPYLMATGAFNGNTIDGLQLYGVSSGANVGPSGAVIIKDNGTTPPHDNHLRTDKTENLHLASGATIYAIQGNTNVISDYQPFDEAKVIGATGTSYIRHTAPTGTAINVGGNFITGVIPGRGTSSQSVDMGIDNRQQRNAGVGVKGYKGNNVVNAAGIKWDGVFLGSVSGATDLAVVDSGTSMSMVADASMNLYPGSSIGPRRFFSGRYYGPANHNLGTLNAVLSTEYAVPVYIPHSITISELAIDLVTVLAGSSVRLGVYANDPTRDAPGVLLSDAGTIDTSATTGIRSITGLSIAVSPGFCWLALVAQGAGPVPIRGITGSLDPVAPTSLTSVVAEINAYLLNSITGSLGNWSAGALATTFNGPKIMLKVA